MEYTQRQVLKNFSKHWDSLENQQVQRRIHEMLETFTARRFDRMHVTDSQQKSKKNDQIWKDALDVHSSTMSIEEILDIFEKEIVPEQTDATKPSFYGFIPSSGHLLYSAAEFLSSLAHIIVISRNSNAGACDVEESVLKWVKGIVGYPDESQGAFVSGTSMGAVLSYVTARDSKLSGPDVYSKAVVYSTEEVHPSNIRALNIAGLRSCHHRYVPLGSDHRMDAEQLESMVESDVQAGLSPFLVIATMGTTGFGLIDPMKDIAAVTKKHHMWFHVDAAYGGFFLLSDQVKKSCEGISLADSITLDCHKGLSAPFGTAVALVRDGRFLKAAMSRDKAYYFDYNLSDSDYSPVDYSFEYTRPFRSFPVWFMLKVLGTSAVVAQLEEKLQLTQYLYKSLQNLPNVEVFSEPDLSIVAFRCVSSNDQDSNLLTKQWLELINVDGKAFLTPTVINGLFYIRLCVLSFRSHIEHIDQALRSIKQTLKSLNYSALTREM